MSSAKSKTITLHADLHQPSPARRDNGYNKRIADNSKHVPRGGAGGRPVVADPSTQAARRLPECPCLANHGGLMARRTFTDRVCLAS
jgi:hypothetical protein